MNYNIESLTLSDMESFANIHPEIEIEQSLSDIKESFMTSPLAQIPFTEMAALGGSFSEVVQKLMTPKGEGLYKCVFPDGVMGKLVQKKGENAFLGTINTGNGLRQARWIPLEKEAIGAASVKAALIAVAVIAVVKQINDIKDGQKEIVDILERDKKSQLIADYDILSTYMDEYKYYWENETSVIVNLNQVKNIKRNAKKDILSYSEQIKDLLEAKNNTFDMRSSSKKIGKLLDRFVHYKLALHVLALSEYMEVMLSKNFQAEYLNSVSEEIREYADCFLELHSRCSLKIETLKKESIAAQAANTAAKAARFTGNLLGKIPIIKHSTADKFMSDLGDTIDAAEQKQLEKTLSFFMRYKESGIIPIAEHIDIINQLSNKPVVMLYDKNIIRFETLKEVV